MKFGSGYIITEVFKTGEKPLKRYRGPKPRGYCIYKDGLFWKFLPYHDPTSIKI